MHNRFGTGSVYQDGSLNAFANSPVFTGLEDAERQELLQMAHLRYLEEGDVLFWEGEACGDVFLLNSGHVKLFRRALNHREAIIGFMGTGEPLGMEALFTGAGYSYSAVAAEDVQVLGFPAWSLQRYVKNHPKLLGRLLSFISTQHSTLIDRIEWLTTCSAEQRLAAYLISQFEESEDEEAISVPRRRVDLAGILGMTAETLCRELKKLREQGCVDIQGSEIFMKNLGQMKNILQAPSAA